MHVIFVNCAICGKKLKILTYRDGDKSFVKTGEHWLKLSKYLYIICNTCNKIKEDD
jgi:hypothetical protein